MNIAFITHYSQLYGANRSLLNLVEGLEQLGEYNCFLIAPNDGQIVSLFSSKGYETFVYPFLTIFTGKHNNIPVENVVFINLNALKIIVSKLIQWKIDLIYTNTSIVDIGLLASKILKIPHVWHIREFGDLDYDIYPIFGNLIHKILLCMSEGLIFISDAVKFHLFNDCLHPNSKVVYNGVVSEAHLSLIKKLDKKKSKDYVDKFAIVGYLHDKKGQMTAIRAFRKVVKSYPDAKLLIAGFGPSLPHLKMAILQTGLEQNVFLLNEIYEPISFFMNVDVGLMCSQHEAMGRVTVEAFAGMCPVIAFNSGANPEIVKHGYNGYLYNSTNELSNFIIEMIKNPHITRQMGLNGYELVKEKFTIETYTHQITKVINNAFKVNLSEANVKISADDLSNLANGQFWKTYNSLLDLDKIIRKLNSNGKQSN